MALGLPGKFGASEIQPSTVMKVKIEGKGVLQGMTLLDTATKKPKCHRFGSIPFALPPTGERRWRKPQPLPSNFSYGTQQNPGNFTKPSSPCPQMSRFGVKSSSEDCLQCNIWVPIGSPPKGGWPVLFWIHGGFLQYGTNNADDPSDLLGSTDVKCVIVSPGYRLGVFGFLASKDLEPQESSPTANFGFWDQRLALEWTYDNVANLGGNPDNITVGGLSAGAYSAFHQLAHDINPSRQRQIIRRVLQFSNGCGVQPKSITEVQQQFECFISVLGIPKTWTKSQRVEAIRKKTADQLVDAVERMDQKFFRPVSDGKFITTDLFASLYNGSFGRRMKELDISIIVGDLTQEFQLYKAIYPPTSHQTLVERLCWDYPRDIVLPVCSQYEPSKSPSIRSDEDWSGIFGDLYADLQVHSTLRGLVQSIAHALPVSHLHRYRIDYRTQSVDKTWPREIGATHATDMSIWFFGNGNDLTAKEKGVVAEWLRPVSSFVKGEQVDWGTREINEVRYLTADGAMTIKNDEWWKTKLPLWELIRKTTIAQHKPRDSKL
ncbi:putative esterase/lipase [Lachnellula suecica]|uniref:Putative esterase/lipase n=1 Tax=Lachnellula suecica TaxID=602035 RepID=A0A8T9CCQ8_9HELO|nr:putative esterase/lipase [Lachnellula suecica]